MPLIMPDYNHYKTSTYEVYCIFFVILMPDYLPDVNNGKIYRKLTYHVRVRRAPGPCC